jgi:proteasome assembly chaperone (PAC2) family protein
MEKQTAVSWLEEELKLILKKVILEGNSKLIESLFEQAKEMEEEQHGNTWDEAIDEDSRYNIFEQYYNETFKSE